MRTPSRVETADLLAAEGMLPAICFVFSRKGCDQAVEQCLAAGLRLTEPGERERIRTIAEAKTAGLADDDLDVLRYDQWLAGLEAGFAAHHAGMVPPMKEAVEEAFAAGLVKMVFATETLALGINMPARSVVIEKLSKFTGERHEFLTPGEYTQLTGRAGRRGIDAAGYAVVSLEPVRAVRPGGVAGVAPQRRAARRRSARPTTWPPTSCAATRSSRPTTSSTCRSRSSTPTATSSRWSDSSTARATRSPGSARSSATTSTRCRSTARSPPRSTTSGATAAELGASPRRWKPCAPATWSWCGARAGGSRC